MPVFVVAIILVVTGGITSSGVHAKELSIGVAANFYQPLKTLLDNYEHRNKIVTHAASTGQLFSQIAQGAPIDVFLSADALSVEKLIQTGHAVTESQSLYACGVLVLWSPTSPISGNHRLLLSDSNKRLALANPATAPYGRAAKQTLATLKLTQQPTLIKATNVAASFQMAYSKAVDFSFVALSQVKQQKIPKTNIWQVPTHYYQAIRQNLVITQHGKANTYANHFVDFILAKPNQERLQMLGYASLQTCQQRLLGGS